jgi:acyl dehydratase
MEFDPAYWQAAPRGSVVPLSRRPLRFLEDFTVGEPFETATHTLTLEQLIAFSRLHDPQYFHIDPEAARDHPFFCGITASGFQTMTITHRLILALDIGHAWGLIGKGMEALRWRRPVRPGDTLRARGRVTRVERDPHHPFGIVATDIETVNQQGETVLSFTVNAVVPVRQAPAARAA